MPMPIIMTTQAQRAITDVRSGPLEHGGRRPQERATPAQMLTGGRVRRATPFALAPTQLKSALPNGRAPRESDAREGCRSSRRLSQFAETVGHSVTIRDI